MADDTWSAKFSRENLRGAVAIEEAIEDGILQRGSNEGMVELPVVEVEVIQTDESGQKTTTESFPRS